MPVTAASKKAFPPPIEFEEEQTEAMNLSSTPSTPKFSSHNVPIPVVSPPASKSPKSPGHSHNPPIVLRIFKGTSQLVTPVDESPPAPPVVKATTPERKSRRRGHSTETAGNVSPKRLRERHKGVSYAETDPDSDFEYEALSGTSMTTASTKSHSERTSKLVNESKTPVSVVESEPDENIVAQVENKEDSGISEPMHISPVVPDCQSLEVETVKDIERVVDETHQIIDSEKIEEGEKLLANTYMDFNAAEKHLLDVKINKTEKDIEREKLLAVLAGEDCDEQMEQHIEKDVQQQKQLDSAETEWFSDSECSDTVPEQMNIASESDLVTNDNICEAPVLSKTPKKRSIFKSRQVGGDSIVPGRKKRFGLYKHKWSGSDGPPGAATPTQTRPDEVLTVNTLEEEFEEAEALTRVTSYPEPDADSLDAEAVTSIKCTKKVKGVRTIYIYLINYVL